MLLGVAAFVVITLVTLFAYWFKIRRPPLSVSSPPPSSLSTRRAPLSASVSSSSFPFPPLSPPLSPASSQRPPLGSGPPSLSLDAPLFPPLSPHPSAPPCPSPTPSPRPSLPPSPPTSRSTRQPPSSVPLFPPSSPRPPPHPVPSPAPSQPASPTVSRCWQSKIGAFSSSSSAASMPCSSRRGMVRFAGSSMESLDSRRGPPETASQPGVGQSNSSSWREVIKQKLRHHKIQHPDFMDIFEHEHVNWTREDLITKLGDPVVFRDTFLVPIAAKFHHGKLTKEIEDEITVLEGESNNNVPMGAAEMIAAVELMQKRHERATDLPVKLVLTTLFNAKGGQGSSASSGGPAASTDLLRGAANLAEFPFGALHSGILLDDTIIEWGRGLCGTSLICPSIDLVTVLCAVDLENHAAWKRFKQETKTIFDSPDSSFLSRLKISRSAFYGLDDAHTQQLDQIAKLCTEWNRRWDYNFATRNCQTFVASFSSTLGLKLEFEGPKMRQFMDSLRRNGSAKLQFGDKSFTTRSSLDNFVMNEIDYKQQEKDDRKLLMVYAHVFEVNCMADPDNKKYKATETAKQFWHDLSKWEKDICNK